MLEYSVYQMVPILTLLGCTTDQRNIPFGYHIHLLIQGSSGSSVFSGVFIAEDDGVGDKGS